MSLMSWLQAKKPDQGGGNGKTKVRRSFRETTLPLISPRRGRRILRREQLFSVVRESLIRAGILSSSYEFKVLALDSNGDGFLVLIDLALPAEVMPDEYLLEIERWIRQSARSRHSMQVQSVYWRRQASQDQRGFALKAAVAAQTQRESQVSLQSQTQPQSVPSEGVPARPRPMTDEEVKSFRQAMQMPAIPKHSMARESQGEETMPEHQPESHSDFSALSETQYGKL